MGRHYQCLERGPMIMHKSGGQIAGGARPWQYRMACADDRGREQRLRISLQEGGAQRGRS